MSLKKVLRIVLIVLIGLLVINFAVKFIGNAKAKKTIINARQEAKKAIDNDIAKASQLLQRLGIADRRIATSELDVCYIRDQAQGWTIAGWYQACYLRYVYGFTTPLTQAEIRDILKAEPKTADYFGEATSTLYGEECTVYEKDFQDSLSYRQANSVAKEKRCGIPGLVQGASYPIGYRNNASIKAYSTLREDDVRNSPEEAESQVWLTFERSYYREPVSCGIGFFCKNPSKSTPLHPDL
ncbi:hypothetical protein CSA80_03085 [Candidatus Saccharibacteria bacterium]|nr:MAG: hypothetical protein CR973_00240 [Candidatus Saccharibacteria bacterium]PID99073.1 MAG: hypothetical protein CSA80_03085 [Candidatus Saccharibacteria bacterium]